jgi:hypothetical protein
MGVDYRGTQMAVTQQFLHRPDIRTDLKHMRGVTVAQ